MAKPMCMSEDGNQAVSIITMYETGDTFNLCDECLAAWCVAMVNQMTGIDPTPFLVAISAPDTIPDEVTAELEAEAAERAAGEPVRPSDPTPAPTVEPSPNGGAGTSADAPEGDASPPVGEAVKVG